MELSGDLLQAALVDLIVFSVEILLALYFIIKRHAGFERVFFLFYCAVTFSAYNIFIQVIHDFNLPIARTALFKIPVIGQLYIFDCVTIFGCFIVFCRFFIGKSKFQYSPFGSNGLFFQFYIRDLIIYILTIFSFYLLLYFGLLVDGASQLRPLRGLAMGFLFSWMFVRLLNNTKDAWQLNYIVRTFLILDLINIVGEIMSAPMFGKYLWDRGGHKVVLLDQANFMLAFCYLPLLFTWKRFGKMTTIFSYFIFLLLLYDFVKGVFLFIPLSLILFFFISMFSKGSMERKFFIPFILITLTGFIVAPSIMSDRAINGTRSIQLNSYISYIENHPSLAILGSSVGGMYPILEDTDDKGEVKEIDRDSASNSVYQVQFQVPFFYYFKIAGIVGIVIVLSSFLIGLNFAIRINYHDSLAGYYAVIALLSALLVPPFLNPEPNEIVYFCRLSFMVASLSIFKFRTNKILNRNFSKAN